MIDLDAIKARCDAATPGQWTPYFSVHGDPYVAQDGRPKFGVVVSTAPDDYGRADCEFLAHARTDVPALVAEVERLRAALTELVEAMAEGLAEATAEAMAEGLAAGEGHE